jgi:hypothetical protein
VNDVARLIVRKKLRNKFLVTDVAVDKVVPVGGDMRYRIEISGISELIQIDDSPVRSPRTQPDKATSNKSGATSHQNTISQSMNLSLFEGGRNDSGTLRRPLRIHRFSSALRRRSRRNAASVFAMG